MDNGPAKKRIVRDAQFKSSEVVFDIWRFTLGNMATQVTLPITLPIEHSITAVNTCSTLSGQQCGQHRQSLPQKWHLLTRGHPAQRLTPRETDRAPDPPQKSRRARSRCIPDTFGEISTELNLDRRQPPPTLRRNLGTTCSTLAPSPARDTPLASCRTDGRTFIHRRVIGCATQPLGHALELRKNRPGTIRYRSRPGGGAPAKTRSALRGRCAGAPPDPSGTA